jgi:hypothetical protein
MQNKLGRPVEKYSERTIVYFTPTQLATLKDNADAAGKELGPYIRDLSLNTSDGSSRPHFTMDGVRYSLLKGMLADVLSRCHKIEDLSTFGDLPLPEDFRLAVAKMEALNTHWLEALEKL